MLLRNPLPWALSLVFVVAGLVACTADGTSSETSQNVQAEEEHAELAKRMAYLQRWTHKAALSLQERNPELADFYLHEMEETVETIQEEVPTYEGHAIADLTEQMLVPTVEAVDEALDDRDWSTVDERVQEMVKACNQCHTATDHGFVQVTRTSDHSYPQDFTPREQ